MLHLNNMIKTVNDVLHQDAARLKVYLEPVPVLPKILEIFPKLENVQLICIKNLADRNLLGRMPSLSESARDVERLDLAQAQVSIKTESRTNLGHEPGIKQL
jgi:hypothetical protein